MKTITFIEKGTRANQEDRMTQGDITVNDEMSEEALVKTVRQMGDALLLSPDGQECEEEDCIAEFSGSTLVATLGNAWVSVGDSLLLLCTLNKTNKQISLKLVNPLHKINHSELKLIHNNKKNKSRLFDLVMFNSASQVGRGRLQGAEMSRALGDFDVHLHGMHHTPSSGIFSYDDTQETAFIIAASDGLINFQLPNDQEFKKRYKAIEAEYKSNNLDESYLRKLFFYQPSRKTDEDYLEKLKNYDIVEKEELDAKLQLFQDAIQAKLNSQQTLSEEIIHDALHETLLARHNNNLDLAADNILFTVAAAGQSGYMVVADGHGGSESAEYIVNNFEAALQKEIKKLQFMAVVKEIKKQSEASGFPSVAQRFIRVNSDSTNNSTTNNTPTNSTPTRLSPKIN